jgi:broad specificity phosphatase PhoE
MSTKKIVYYMRHFEALHNIQPYNYSIRDPELSPLGQTQALTAIESVKNISSIDLIVCSPLIRTLQTYLLVFNNRRNLPLVIHPDLQEVCTEPCDIGSPVDDLKIKFPILLDELNTFGQAFGDKEWLDKINPENIYSPKQIQERAKRFHNWLVNRSEKHIFVISHNIMLQQLLQDTSTQKISFKNGEIKKIEHDC